MRYYNYRTLSVYCYIEAEVVRARSMPEPLNYPRPMNFGGAITQRTYTNSYKWIRVYE